MRAIVLISLFICYFCVKEYVAQYWNYLLLPGNEYIPNCFVPMEEAMPNFLVTCLYYFTVPCVLNISVPFAYYLRCEERTTYASLRPSECEKATYNRCESIKGLHDPGYEMYAPLWHPEEPVRLYPEILKAMEAYNRSYTKSFIIALRNTFTGPYRGQYNYAWNRTAG